MLAAVVHKRVADEEVIPATEQEAVEAVETALEKALGISSTDKPSPDAQEAATGVSLETQGSEEDPAGAPAATVYKTHSTDILEVLEDLKEKAEEELAALRKAESNAKQNYEMLKLPGPGRRLCRGPGRHKLSGARQCRGHPTPFPMKRSSSWRGTPEHLRFFLLEIGVSLLLFHQNENYEMLKQSLDDAKKNDNQDLTDEKAAKKAAEEERATDKKDLAMTNALLADTNADLASIKADCMPVAADHEQTVAGRNAEITTIDEAMKILKDTTTGAVQQTYDFLQVAQGSRMRMRADLKNAEVANAVQQLAKKCHSAALAQLASRINAVIHLGTAAGDDPFVKVRKLIVDLIAKLEAEATAAAEEKAWCDDEMAKTEEKKSELEEDISTLTGKIDKASAASAMLKSEVKELQGELAALAKLQSEMDQTRADQKAAYDKAKAELTEGIAGVRRALNVLRQYYGSKAESEALLQDGQPAKPVLFKKAEGAGGSIIGILEVVEPDFAQELAKEEALEADSIADYEKDTQANKVSKTKKSQAVVYKVQEFKSLDKAIADMSSERATKDEQLKAVNSYYSKVKDRCIAKPETHEERKARREAEIAGLKEALSILESQTVDMKAVFAQVGTKRSASNKFRGKLEAM